MILGLSLVLATVSWAGFVMTRTVLDPSRSERLADQVFDNEQLRGAISDRLAAGLQTAIPGDLVVPPELIQAAADRALDDPAVQTLVREGIVATHRNALEGKTEPVTIDASALGRAVRTSLIELSPTLEPAIPAIPPIEVTLPTGGLSFLGKIRNFVEQATIIGAALSLVGSLIALVLTTDRPAILRRVAFWAFGAAAFWVAVGYGVPWLAGRIAPSSGAIISAIIDVFFGAMIRPAITLAIVGAALLGASLAWAAFNQRQPSLASAQGASTPMHQSAGRQLPRTPGVSSNIRPPRHGPPTPGNPNQTDMPFSGRTASPQIHPTNPGVDPTATQPQSQSQPRPTPPRRQDPWDVTEPTPPRSPKLQPHWVEGVGYVDPEANNQ